MATENVLIALIDWPKPSKEERTRDKDFVAKLGLSLKSDGLLQPIAVRPNAEKVGRFIGVAGWHRCEAYRTVLKLESIEATVLADMTDEEASAARTAENLFRNPLSKAQAAHAIAVWHDHYDKARLAAVEVAAKTKAEAKRASGKPVSKARVAEADSAPQVQTGPGTENVETPADTDAVGAAAVALALEAEAQAQAEACGVVEPPAPEPVIKNFAKHAAAITGKSETTIKRALKIGQAFSPDQLEVFEQCKVGQAWMETIAAMPEGKRAAVVNFIGSGLDPAEAIAKVDETPEVVRADGATFEVPKPPEGTEKADDDMNDDEWVAYHCSETIALLPDPAVFKAHACLYRASRKFRHEFKTKMKGLMATAKGAGLYSGFVSLVTRLTNVAHPRHWYRCGSCAGTGIRTEGIRQAKCNECSGNGFVVKIESK